VNGAYYAAATQASATVENMDKFKEVTKDFVEKTNKEFAMNHYGFSY
jgi:hypothetical protein